jgi:hypothetical protein
MKIDRDFCIGLFILGILAHYNADEVSKDKGISYIALQLRKRHFELKNGSVEVRQWINEEYVKNLLKKTKKVKKREELVSKHTKAINKMVATRDRWLTHSAIANKAWKKACDKFPSNNPVTTNQLIFALVRKNESVSKFYSFNKKKIEAILKPDPNRSDNYILKSNMVANALLDELDSQIAYYNFNNKVEA